MTHRKYLLVSIYTIYPEFPTYCNDEVIVTLRIL